MTFTFVRMENMPNNVVFFDGVCGLCNCTVNWLIRRDRFGILRFAPLQGITAKQILGEKTSDMNSVIFVQNGVVFEKSEAFFALANLPGLGLKWLRVFRIFPLGLRDRVYDWIARHRYRWWGKHETCRIPTPAERKFFLD